MLTHAIYILSRLLLVLACGPATEPIMEPITLNQVLEATGGRPATGDPQGVVCNRIVVDSRAAQAGDLFWALPGTNHDGHAFIHEAVRRGAVACIVNERGQSPQGIPTVVVGSTHRALGELARWYRGQMDAQIVGVTGTVGKTTAREMIHAALAVGFRGCRSQKNFNNHIGLPLSVLQIERRHQFAVLEMGASHVGEIGELAGIAAPEIGVVTRIGIAHLEGFGSVDAIRDAKGELVQALPKDGVAVLNGDDPKCVELAGCAACRVVLVGCGVENKLRATTVEFSGPMLRFRVDGAEFRVRAAGRHHLVAALSSIAIAKEFGLRNNQIAEGLDQFVPVEGRCQVRKTGPWTVIDDTYNANPSSLEAACVLLSEWNAAGKRVLVMGDMAELGSQSAFWHEHVGCTAARCGVDRLVACGQYASQVTRGAAKFGMDIEQLACCDDLAGVRGVLDSWIEPGDVVLVKGSRSMGMERVAEWLCKDMRNTKEIYNPCDGTRA
jgi:UDP-N-acetylmuramoyl-tripeptide--D-alanyl-D-alanine ligase